MENPQLTRLSREGIPLSLYKMGHVAFSVPGAVLFWLWCRYLSFFVSERSFETPASLTLSRALGSTPTLILGLHRELGFFCCSQGLKNLANTTGAAWVGIHDWSSYWGSFELWLIKSPCFRFSRPMDDQGQRPMEQIVSFLRAFNKPVMIRTDAGGPYDQVKVSAVRMAIQAKRNILIFRQTSTKSFPTIVGHRFPSLFSEIRTAWSREVTWQELVALSEVEARDLLQQVAEETSIQLLGKLESVS